MAVPERILAPLTVKVPGRVEMGDVVRRVVPVPGAKRVEIGILAGLVTRPGGPSLVVGESRRCPLRALPTPPLPSVALGLSHGLAERGVKVSAFLLVR